MISFISRVKVISLMFTGYLLNLEMINVSNDSKFTKHKQIVADA